MTRFVFFIGLFAATLSASENERILESGTYSATLYLHEIQFDEFGGKISLDLAWIPAVIEKACVGKNFLECHTRDHCRHFRFVQKCKLDLTDCKEVTHPDCVPFPEVSEPSPTAPHRLLNCLVSDPKLVNRLMKQWKLGPPTRRKTTLLEVEARYQTRAKVKWEKWTNGENFSVVDVTN